MKRDWLAWLAGAASFIGVVGVWKLGAPWDAVIAGVLVVVAFLFGWKSGHDEVMDVLKGKAAKK